MRSWYTKIAAESPLLTTRKDGHRRVIIPPAAHDVDSIIEQLSYKSSLGSVYQNHFVEQDADNATRTFLQMCLDKYDKCNMTSWVRTMWFSLLRNFMTQTDALGASGAGQMHIISREQLNRLQKLSYDNEPLQITEPAQYNPLLFKPNTPQQFATTEPQNLTDTNTVLPTGKKTSIREFGSLLDIGAGNGRMAELFRDLFDVVECTEVSAPMIKAIEEKGFIAHHTADIDSIPKDKKYDVIGLFNLIDRCSTPITLLRQLKHRQKDENARLVIAVPQPLRPSVETKDGWIEPTENIAPKGCYCEYTWEESLRRLIVDIIDPLYDVRVISRLPYLSEGDFKRSYHVLDDVILVLSLKSVQIPKPIE